MIRVKSFLLLILVINICFPVQGAFAETGPEQQDVFSTRQIVEAQEESLDLAELEKFIHQVDEEINSYLPDLSLKNMIQAFKEGKISLSPQEILKDIWGYFFHEVGVNLSLLGKLLVISVICLILHNLQSAFENATVGKMAYFVCYLALITIAVSSFKVAVTAGLAAIGKMVVFMKLLLPVLLVLLTALGGLTSAALLQPFLMVFISFMGYFTEGVIFPLIYLSAVLTIVNNISDRFKVSRIAGLFRQITKIALGLVLTLFIGVITVEGVAGAVVDGVTLRTAKYMTGAFVPVAGSMFADALDAVMGGSLILKNAVGLSGVIILAVIVLFPVIKIMVIALVYRFAAALLQPMGDSLISDTLEDMSGILFLTFATVLTVAIMFFLTITIIIGAANFTIMLR